MDNPTKSSLTALDPDNLWEVYQQLHDADTTTEAAMGAVDTWLRQALIEAWVRQSADRLALLGARSVTVVCGGDQTITVQMDALE